MPHRRTPLDVERGLTALAIAGNSLEAARMTGYPDRTIRGWQAKHPEKWQEIKNQRTKLIAAACADEWRTLELAATRASQMAVGETVEQLQAGTIKDPAGAARNLATTAGISADKIANYEGRPTTIIEHRSGEDVLRALEQRGFVDSTAHEEVGELTA